MPPVNTYRLVLCTLLWLWLLPALQAQMASVVPDTVVAGAAYPASPSIDSMAADMFFHVRTIHIKGNRKTQENIILREIPFREGDDYRLPDLVKKFEDARRQLMNTALFHEVSVYLKSFYGYDVEIGIEVKERWYLFPVPYFKWVDRNLNQWLVENKASLDRVNYGLKLLYSNSTGRNDKLKLYLINGYTKEISFSYDRPYIDNRMKWGLTLGFAYGKNREVNYNTIDNKQVFIKDENNFMRTYTRAVAILNYRRAIRTRHSFGVSWYKETLRDTIAKLNPEYFSAGKHTISFPDFFYNMYYFDVDYNPYPLRGYTAEINVNKRGLNKEANVWSLTAKGAAYRQLGSKYYFSLKAAGTVKAPFKQPYINQRLLGYGDITMQGYEYYVIDGVAGGYMKASLSRELLNFQVRLPNIKKKKTEETEALAPNRIPVRVYGKIYGNAGYVHNPLPGQNFLSNTMLWSGGIGIDVITFYDFVVKFEWSFNQLGQNGLYLQRKSYY